LTCRTGRRFSTTSAKFAIPTRTIREVSRNNRVQDFGLRFSGSFSSM
jgi:hypothetical protein